MAYYLLNTKSQLDFQNQYGSIIADDTLILKHFLDQVLNSHSSTNHFSNVQYSMAVPVSLPFPSPWRQMLRKLQYILEAVLQYFMC